MYEPRKPTPRQFAFLASLARQLGGDWDDPEFRAKFVVPDYGSQTFTRRDASIVIDLMLSSLERQREITAALERQP